MKSGTGIIWFLFSLIMMSNPLWAGDRTFNNSAGMKFVLIKPGSFMMGSPKSERGRDLNENQHQVVISRPFYMQTTEVTQGQWRSVMGSNPSSFKDCGDDCPVENVSWLEAQEFIRRLNAREETDKYRLPTEAEWEYACRAASKTAFANGGISKRRGGRDPRLDRIGWYRGNSNNQTHPAARKQPNAWGLYDMHGNVCEFCQDWYGDYPSGQMTDPTGPPSGSERVWRGGCYFDVAPNCRSAMRYKSDPGDRDFFIGFRLARTP